MRARGIKPSFFDNEELAELSTAHRLLFVGLWCLADREGRLEDRPARVKKQLFGYDGDTPIDAMLDDLGGKGFLLRYEVDGRRFIWLPTFTKHQKPHHNESVSVIPAFSGELSTIVASASGQGSKHFALTPSSLTPDSGLLTPDRLMERGSKSHFEKFSGFYLEAFAYMGDAMPEMTVKRLEEWTDAYPRINFANEMMLARDWIMENETKRPKKSPFRFLSNWFKREAKKITEAIPKTDPNYAERDMAAMAEDAARKKEPISKEVRDAVREQVRGMPGSPRKRRPLPRMAPPTAEEIAATDGLKKTKHISEVLKGSAIQRD